MSVPQFSLLSNDDITRLHSATRPSYEKWASSGKSTLKARLKDEVARILNEHDPVPIAGDKQHEVEELIAAYDPDGWTNYVGNTRAAELNDGENGNITEDPLFEDPKAGDWRLAIGSPSRDTGTNTLWTAIGTDLDGSARQREGDGNGSVIVDMGCYEAAPPGSGSLTCQFDVTPEIGFVSVTSTLIAFVDGADTNGVTYAWDLDNNGSTDATGQIITNVFTTGFHTVKLTVDTPFPENAARTRGLRPWKLSDSQLFDCGQHHNTHNCWIWRGRLCCIVRRHRDRELHDCKQHLRCRP